MPSPAPDIPESLISYLNEIAERLTAGHAAVMVGAGFSRNASRSGSSRTDVSNLSQPIGYIDANPRLQGRTTFASRLAPGQLAPEDAYVLKEAFGQLWDYRTERGARAFFTLERRASNGSACIRPEVRRKLSPIGMVSPPTVILKVLGYFGRQQRDLMVCNDATADVTSDSLKRRSWRHSFAITQKWPTHPR